MTARPPPGPQLGRGRVRVDAARAIAKLREYQLPDKTAWVLEAIRAAVAARALRPEDRSPRPWLSARSRATQLELTGDSNDVWLAWLGEPWPGEDLAHLFDELVSPEAAEDRQHVRLLAAAVNSALGMDPVYVDVYSIAADGSAVRARYTPDVLVESGEQPALREVAARPAAAPIATAGAGMLVHLRRRVLGGIAQYLFGGSEPPELPLARAACRDLALPLSVGGVALGGDRPAWRSSSDSRDDGGEANPDPMSRSTPRPIDEPVIDAANPDAMSRSFGEPRGDTAIDLANRGQASRSFGERRDDGAIDAARGALSRSFGETIEDDADTLGAAIRGWEWLPLGESLDGYVAIDLGNRGPASVEVAEHGVVLATYALDRALIDEPRARVPLRVFVDAPRLPTNASRSQVRREAYPVASAEARARALIPVLVDRIANELRARPTPALRHTALALLAAAIAGGDWRDHVRALAPPLRGLAVLPLLRDATGVPKPVLYGWNGLVHTGGDPHPESLRPWLETVVWMPAGDPAALLLGETAIDPSRFAQHLARARRQQRAHRRFHERPQRAPTVIARVVPRIRMRLGAPLAPTCIDPSVFEGLAGEVCLDTTATGGELVLLLSGREIERMTYDSPIGFHAVIDAPHVVPTDGYHGIERDGEHARVERAMRAGVVRAIEAIALALRGASVPDGFAVFDTGDRDRDRNAIRAGLALALALGVAIREPLVDAPVWTTTDGAAVSVVDLRAQPAIGVVPAGARVRSKPGRIVVDGADRKLIARLAPAVRVIRYEAGDARPGAAALATQLLPDTGFAVAVREGELVGAIGPLAAGSMPAVRLHHTGVAVATASYTPEIAPCVIAVDSDAVVPTEDWRGVADDAGLLRCSYREWELELVRIAARALCGDRPTALCGPTVELDTALGRTLASAVADHAPAELLGDALLAKLRAQPLFALLGRRDLVSADDLRERFADAIPYVEAPAEPVDELAPLIADAVIARFAGTLTAHPVVEASQLLERERVAGARRARIAQHRAAPPRVVSLPGPTVPIATVEPSAAPLRSAARASDAGPHPREAGPLAGRADVRGIVGLPSVARERAEIEILVEGRRFCAIEPAGSSPVVAVVEIDERHLDAAFATVPHDVVDAIATAVEDAVPALLVAAAQQMPQALAEPGPLRTLAVHWVTSVASFDEPTRVALCGVRAWPTLAGKRVSLGEALRDRAIAAAAWTDRWLPAEPGAAASELDGNVLALPDASELDTLVRRLHRGAVIDMTHAAATLQARRRIAHGLVAMPRISPPAWFACALADLGDVGRQLGAGEIGLVEEDASEAQLYAGGVLRSRMALGALPYVRVAIEAPEYADAWRETVPVDTVAAQLRALRTEALPRHPIADVAQELALELARRALAERGASALPPLIRRNVRRAILAQRPDDPTLAGAAVFETTRGTWASWTDVAAQRALFEQIWYVPAVRNPDAPITPLDERRIVFVFDATDRTFARELAIDATTELALDATARTNRARPRARTLTIEPRSDLLGEIELTGDGVTAPRGVVGVLRPAAAHRRGVHAHRALHPFDRSQDPARWPTLAVVDDARLEPDRTWSQPQPGHAWSELVLAIRKASDAALEGIASPPANALVVESLRPHSYGGLMRLHDAPDLQLAGALWLVGAPHAARPTSVTIIDAALTRAVVPADGIGMGGTIYAYAPTGWSGDHVGLIQELCSHVHRRLLRALGARTDADPDLAAAHLAHGLALAHIMPGDARGRMFSCTTPEPVDAVRLAELLHGTGRVRVYALDRNSASPFGDAARPGEAGAFDEPRDEPGVVDDRSELARVVIAALGARASRFGRATAVRPVEPAPIAPAPRDPLGPLIDKLDRELAASGVVVPAWTYAQREQPMLRLEQRGLVVGSENPRLLALAAALAAGSPFVPDAIAALAAHAITAMRVADASVTSLAEERALAKLLARAVVES